MKNYTYVLRFFENPRNMTCYVFFELLRTFSRTLPAITYTQMLQQAPALMVLTWGYGGNCAIANNGHKHRCRHNGSSIKQVRLRVLWNLRRFVKSWPSLRITDWMPLCGKSSSTRSLKFEWPTLSAMKSSERRPPNISLAAVVSAASWSSTVFITSLSGQLSLAIPLWVGAMSTSATAREENGEFCVTVIPGTRTGGILT